MQHLLKRNRRTVSNNLPTKNIFWIDVVKAAAIIGVVLIHASAKTVYLWGEIDFVSWQYAHILNSFSRISVLLFVMASGALLLNKKETLATFFLKRSTRIFFPWLFWGSIIYIFFKTDQNLQEVFLGGFWYIPLIVGLYFITPLLRVYVSKAKSAELYFYLIFWFIIVSVIPTFLAVLLDKTITYPLVVSYSGVYMGGHLLAQANKFTQRMIVYTSLIFLTNIVVIILGTYQLSLMHNKLSEVLYAFLSVPVVFSSFSAFALIKHFFSKIKLKPQTKIKKMVALLSQHSLGIFLTNATILELILSNKLLPTSFILTIALVTILTSLLIITILKKIPLLKHLIG